MSSSELHCGQVVCGVGRGDRPLRHHCTLPRTLRVALAQCGLEEEAQVALLGQRIKEAAEAAMAAVLALEAGLSVEQRGGRQVQTDFLGEYRRRGLGGMGTGLGDAQSAHPRPAQAWTSFSQWPAAR